MFVTIFSWLTFLHLSLCYCWLRSQRGGLPTERADGLSLPNVFMDQVPFCPCFLQLSLWRVCLQEEVNLRAAAWSVQRGKCWGKMSWCQTKCRCLNSSREMLPPYCKPHPVHPEEPAAPISLNRPGLDRVHALPLQLGITTSQARWIAIMEMGTLPTATLGWTRDKYNVLAGWHRVPLSSLQVPVWLQWAGAAQPAKDGQGGSGPQYALSCSGSHVDKCDLEQGNCHSNIHT